ncbi:MAG TPA: hypothetical protein VE710_18155 [Candidatus Bathyarchaeia archaeon]|nr:hypothetical protein [Candidatus Bathyarchaeia archaeon]
MTTEPHDKKETLLGSHLFGKLLWAMESEEPEALKMREELINALSPKNREKLEAILQK